MDLVDRIKYDARSDQELIWKYGSRGSGEQPRSEQIRLGAQLIVNQSQEAVFVKGGQALDVFGPGTHTLSTANIPLLSKLLNLPFGGKTPFTAEIWFVNRTVKRDLPWGTRTPVQVKDPEYNLPVQIKAHGLWGFRITDSRSFLTQIVGTLPEWNRDKVAEYFAGEIAQRLPQIIGQIVERLNLPTLKLASRISEISQNIAAHLTPEFSRFGLEIVNFNVESITIGDEEFKAIQDAALERIKIEQLSQATVGAGYTTKRQLDVLEKAASNDGAAGALLSSGLGLGLGLGGGIAAGQQLGNVINSGPASPKPSVTEDPIAKLQKLKTLLDQGLVTQQEFDAYKKKILDAM